MREREISICFIFIYYNKSNYTYFNSLVAEDLCNNQITYPPIHNEDKDYLDAEENIAYQISDLKV